MRIPKGGKKSASKGGGGKKIPGLDLANTDYLKRLVVCVCVCERERERGLGQCAPCTCVAMPQS